MLIERHPSGARSLAQKIDEPNTGFYVILGLIVAGFLVAGLLVGHFFGKFTKNDPALEDAKGYFDACRTLNYEPAFCVEITQKARGYTLTLEGEPVAKPKAATAR